MRNLLRVILGVFATSLSRTSDAPPLNTRLRTLSNKAILCVRYISDFILLAQYKTHSPGSIQSMKDYLEDFHKYKEVFLRFRATKAVKHAAKEAAREFRSEQRLNASDEAPARKRQKQTQVQLESEDVVNDILTEGAHYNFPKMHLVSHFADQITQYGSLPQYSTEICEASHKPLKDAYRRSNHVNAIPQIINTYMQGHAFAMREKNLEQWSQELEHIPADIQSVIHPTRPGIHLPRGTPPEERTVKLQGRIDTKMTYNLHTLEVHYQISDLQELTMIFLTQNSYTPSYIYDLKHAPLEAFNTLQVPVPTFDNDGHVLHKLRCTGPDLFRQQEKRHDWVWVRRRQSAANPIPGSLDGRLPAQLNALFELRDIRNNTCLHLAHISFLNSSDLLTQTEPRDMKLGYRSYRLRR